MAGGYSKIDKKLSHYQFPVLLTMIKIMKPIKAKMKIIAKIFNLQFLQYNILSSC